MMKRYLRGLGVGLLLAGFAITGLSTEILKGSGGDNGGVASAAPTVPITVPIVPGSGWNFFTFPSVIGGAASSCFTYTSTGATAVTVTDAFCIGDVFHVYDNNVLLCDTSPVASEFPNCLGVANPDAAIATGLYSNATCKICSAGAHEICVTVKALWGPGGGGAWLRVDDATCTVGEACAEGGTAVDAACPTGGVYGNHGAYVSCVAAATNAYLATLTGFTSDELEEISSCIVNPRARSTVGKK